MARREFIEVNDFSRGVVTDVDPGDAPINSMGGCSNFMCDRPGMLYRRGGWLKVGTTVANRYPKLVAFVPDFAGASQKVWVGDNDHLFLSDGTDKGTLTVSPCNAVIYRTGGTKNILVFLGAGATPRKYTGSGAIAALGGTPPSGCTVGTVYKTRLVVGTNAANPVRTYFSPTPDIEAAWDLTNAWVDSEHPPTGYAALQNMLLVFTEFQTERLVGTTPPPGTDFDHGVVGPVGCLDHRSIVVWRNNAIFANAQGVYMTNGIGFRDLTAEGGVKLSWINTVANFTGTIASCVIAGMLIVSLCDSGQNELAVFCCNLNASHPVWWYLDNFDALHFASAYSAGLEEVYGATSKGGYMIGMHDILIPTTNVKDGDGSSFTSAFSTQEVGHGMGLQHFGLGYLDYNLGNPSASPTYEVYIGGGREPGGDVPESPLIKGIGMNRFTIARQARFMQMIVTQTVDSTISEIYGYKVETRPFQPRRIDFSDV